MFYKLGLSALALGWWVLVAGSATTYGRIDAIAIVAGFAFSLIALSAWNIR